MKKKVLLLSTGDVHGAYEAIYRIGLFLKEDSYEVAMVVKNKTKGDDFVIQYSPNYNKNILSKIWSKAVSVLPNFKNKIQTLPKYSFLTIKEKKNYAKAKTIASQISFIPDVVIAGMMYEFGNTTLLKDLQKLTGAKIFQLTVDMAPLTGGCHFAWDCKGYESNCSNCPAIVNEKDKYIAKENFALKLKNKNLANINIIAGSGWTQEQAKRSFLFKNQKEILNTNSLIDIDLFNGNSRDIAKKVFGIANDSKVIFTGSHHTNDIRKGYNYFVEALQKTYDQLEEKQRDKVVVLIAANHHDKEQFNYIPFNKKIVDYIKDYRLLSLAYQASDVFICASIEDSGPMMVSEALACGTPVVGFEMGIVSNMVIPDYNGYKAILKDSDDMAKGIVQIISLDKEQFNRYSKNAIKQVVDHSSKKTLLEVVEKVSFS